MMKKNAFQVEKFRDELSKKNNLIALKKTYFSSLAEISDLNTSAFWDKRYKKEQSLSFQDPMTRDRIKKVFKLIPARHIKILNIGAGFGWIEELLSEENIELWSNDFSLVAVENLKNKFKGKFSKQSIYNLKYRSKFECILILEVLEHIPPSKVMKVLKSIKNMLSTNGILIVSVPLNEDLENMPVNLNGHVRVYTQDLIKAELRISGFKILETRYLYAFSNLYFIKSLISKILKIRNPNNIIIKTQKI